MSRSSTPKTSEARAKELLTSLETPQKPTVSAEIRSVKKTVENLEERIATLEQLVVNLSAKLDSFSEDHSEFRTKYEEEKTTLKAVSSTPYTVMKGRGPEINRGKTISVSDILASNSGDVFNYKFDRPPQKN